MPFLKDRAIENDADVGQNTAMMLPQHIYEFLDWPWDFHNNAFPQETVGAKIQKLVKNVWGVVPKNSSMGVQTLRF